jgi:hypothetical protein
MFLMTHNEKEKLLSMFLHSANWCKDMEARDSSGNSVSFDDSSAVAWDLTGGLCLLFGWNRAEQLFPQLVRYLLKGTPVARSPSTIQAMVALQEFNDHPGTTHDSLLAQLRTIPVWIRGPRELSPIATLGETLQGDA